ncbi:hypothetical protein TcCL_ESM06045 [Trypanosoma cruzi]|nr:hypothetical protein TcCL_ESM06045 [Trypanosoma cruzi]
MDEQCTGNTQRLPPAPAGATAGASLFLTCRQTPNDAHAKNTTSGMQKSTTALRCTHALPPVVLLLSLQRTRTSLRTPENPPSTDTQREEHVSRYSFWKQINPQLSQAPRMPHHSLTPQRQHHAHKKSTRQITDSNSSHRSNRSQNLVRACVLSHRPTTCATWLVCMHVLLCLATSIIAEQLCATRESKESNGRKRSG